MRMLSIKVRNFDAYPEHMRVGNLCVHRAYGSGTDATMKFEKVPSKQAEHSRKELVRALSILNLYAEHAHKKINDALLPPEV
jgi:hypothetical protein